LQQHVKRYTSMMLTYKMKSDVYKCVVACSVLELLCRSPKPLTLPTCSSSWVQDEEFRLEFKLFYLSGSTRGFDDLLKRKRFVGRKPQKVTRIKDDGHGNLYKTSSGGDFCPHIEPHHQQNESRRIVRGWLGSSTGTVSCGTHNMFRWDPRVGPTWIHEIFVWDPH
jgi:hypothetical protein